MHIMQIKWVPHNPRRRIYLKWGLHCETSEWTTLGLTTKRGNIISSSWQEEINEKRFSEHHQTGHYVTLFWILAAHNPKSRECVSFIFVSPRETQLLDRMLGFESAKIWDHLVESCLITWESKGQKNEKLSPYDSSGRREGQTWFPDVSSSVFKKIDLSWPGVPVCHGRSWFMSIVLIHLLISLS